MTKTKQEISTKPATIKSQKSQNPPKRPRKKALKTELVTSKKLEQTLKILENLKSTLGLDEQINFDIKQTSPNELKLKILNKEANFNVPWFCIKDEEPFIFMPAEILDVVFKMLKNEQKENFELRLERSIWQHMPLDFGDVWRVAIDELNSEHFKKEPDLDKLLDKIKKEHPNLFVNVANLVGKE